MSTAPVSASEDPDRQGETTVPRGRFSITIGPFTFPTKGAAKEYTSNLLRTLPLGEVENKHVHFLVALLNRHPRAHQKIGAGLLGFEVREHETYGGHCFWLIRRDGTETDFSYRECLSPSTDKTSATAAFRQEIQYQCFQFKESKYRSGMICEITGEPLDYDEIDVDHAPPMFTDILKRFLAEQGLRLEDVACREGDGVTIDSLQDRKLASLWHDFHRKHANLYLLSRAGHRIVTRGSRE